MSGYYLQVINLKYNRMEAVTKVPYSAQITIMMEAAAIVNTVSDK
jgi:hypothetical protein